MACPALTTFVLTDHARFEIERRQISEEEIASVLHQPEQTEEQRQGRCVYQARVPGGSSGVYLLRIFVDVDREPPEVVTAYRTSKVEKYWRLYARSL